MISWWWLIPAFAVGVFAGVSVICLCCAAREADREIEEFTRRIEEAGRF